MLLLFLSLPAASETQAAVPLTRPIEDPSNQALSRFYESLTRTSQGEWVSRIVHYGDSHVAADILTAALRRQLQLAFGDAGIGFVLPGRPWSGYSRSGVTSQTSAGWQIEGLSQASVTLDDRLGIAGVSLNTLANGEWITLTAAGSYFDIYALKQPGGGSITILLDGIEQKRNISLASRTTEPIRLEIVSVTDAIHKIEIRTSSPGRSKIFGIAIEHNSSGLVYDVFGINGARASRPMQWNWKVLARGLGNRSPDLIVVAYGSNEVTDVDLDINEYQANFELLLNRFQEAVPHASILVIGPPDRAIRAGQVWKTASRMTALVDAQRRAAFAAGAAFYDLFNAMGGSGSIQRWASQFPPLAQQDRVHLTAGGYRLVAEWLYTALMAGYLESDPKTGATGWNNQ